MINKKQIAHIRAVSKEARKDFRNRALLVIETLCEGDIIYTDIEKLQEDIYRIAHSAITPRTCKHADWIKETEELFKSFEKEGLL